MATNLDIPPKLLTEAVRLGKHKSKKAAVEQALVEYINRRKQQGILKQFGTVDYDEDYDYKKARSRN